MKGPVKFHPSRLLFAAALALVASGAIAYWSFSASAEPDIPAGVSLASWHRNGQGGRYLLQIAQGQPLRADARLTGTVLSDTNCRADAQGLSHCHNAIKLANGRQITVVNTHQMNRNRCLAPGDHISLSAINSNWMVGTLVKK